MKILALASPRYSKSSVDILAAAASRGHAIEHFKFENYEPKRLLASIAHNGIELPLHESVNSELLRIKLHFNWFRPHVLLLFVDSSDEAASVKALKDVLPRLLTAYVVSRLRDGQVRLVNATSRKKRTLDFSGADRIISIILSETMSAAHISPETIDPTGADFDAIAGAHIVLSECAAKDMLPGLGRSKSPDFIRAGALESVFDGDILHEEMLWVKGWLDWDESRFSRLLLNIEGREWPLDVTACRSDITEKDIYGIPRNFGGEIEITHLYGSIQFSLWIEDRSGLRIKWRERQIWISRTGPIQSRTPLIRGTVQMTGTTIRCAPVSDGRRLTHLAAWQSGRCLAAWSENSIQGQSENVILDVGRALFGAGLIHLHAGFDNERSVTWAVLDPATGEPPSADRFDESVIASSINMPLLAALGVGLGSLPNETLNVLVDGKPSVRHSGACEPARTMLNLGFCGGLALLEAETAGGWRRTVRLWRSQRGRTGRGHLPAFILPPAGPDTTAAPASGIPKVVLIRQASAPTDELYVLSGIEDRAAQGEIDLQIVDLATDARNAKTRASLLCKGAIVIVSRYLTDEWINDIARHHARLRGVYYLMDDDVTLAENDIKMPGGYRKRMIDVAHGEFQSLLHLCSRFIVTSEFLAERFASDRTDLLTPPYIRPCETLDHLEDLSEIRIEYHGTQVHRADLDAISSALVWIHNTYPQVRLRTYMGRFAPNRLRDLERVEIVPDLPWSEYREVVAASKAHIALAPMLGTPYNRAKSFVKIMDIARLGAAGLYTRAAPYASVVTHGKDGFLLENDPLIWQYALAWLIENPDELRGMALAGQHLAHRLSRAHHPASYWDDTIFGLKPSTDAFYTATL